MRYAFLLAIFLSASSCLASASDDFSFSAPKGPYDVGFHVVQQFDYTRQYRTDVDLVTGKLVSGEKARPIQTLVWYPSEPGGRHVTYADYLRTAITEEDFDLAPQVVQQRYNDLFSDRAGNIGLDRANRLADKPMLAIHDAKARVGRFPVVIYAASFGAAAMENADLCEYLASKGYVVIASRSLGAHSFSMTEDIDGIEAQAGDIEFLIGYAHSLPNVDLTQVAVAGYSWGGISNVFAAARDKRIRALVALDGSVRSYPQFVDGGAEAARNVSPDRVTVPLLYAASEPHSIEWLVQTDTHTNYSFLHEMKYSDVYFLTMHPMVHMNFSSLGMRFEPDGEFAEYSRDEVSKAHSWVARYVGEFLDAYIKNNLQAREFLANSPAANGVPVHAMTVESFKGTGKPASREAFVATLASQGFENAVDIYRKFKEKNPKFSLDANELNAWGYKLLRGGQQADAIGIFTLAATIYPDDGNAFDSLADGYEHVHNIPEAIKNYRKSLSLDDKNTHAVERLKQLGADGKG